jgi:hypothetical protein
MSLPGRIYLAQSKQSILGDLLCGGHRVGHRKDDIIRRYPICTYLGPAVHTLHFRVSWQLRNDNVCGYANRRCVRVGGGAARSATGDVDDQST